MEKTNCLITSLDLLWMEYKRRLLLTDVSPHGVVCKKAILNQINSYMEAQNYKEYHAAIGQEFILHLKREGKQSSGTLNNYVATIKQLDGCLTKEFWSEQYKLFLYVIKNKSVSELYEQVCADLKNRNLKTNMRSIYHRGICRLDIFMQEYGMSIFSPSVGEEFIKLMDKISVLSAEMKRLTYRVPIERLILYQRGSYVPGRISSEYTYAHHELKDNLQHLKDRLFINHFSESVIRNTDSIMKKLDLFMTTYGIEHYDSTVGNQFLQQVDYYDEVHSAGSKHRDYYAVSYIAHLNDLVYGRPFQRYHLKQAGIIPDLFGDLISLFLVFCRNKGNRPTTIEGKRKCLSRFIVQLKSLGVSSTEDITSQIIIVATSKMNGGNWATIREFLKWCYDTSAIAKDYSFAVPHLKKRHVIPPYYTKEERLKLESAPDRSTPLGKRDYAIIMILNHLGLRSSDLVNLELGFIENDGSFCINQYKTDNPQSLPMLENIKHAVRDYIENGRPASDSDHIFLMAYAPYTQLSPVAIHGIITKYMLKAGINISARRHGGHALRASMSTSMVNNGLTYNEVRRMIGHTSDDAIKHYASLDINHLRLCSLEVYPATGRFASGIKDGGNCSG